MTYPSEISNPTVSRPWVVTVIGHSILAATAACGGTGENQSEQSEIALTTFVVAVSEMVVQGHWGDARRVIQAPPAQVRGFVEELNEIRTWFEAAFDSARREAWEELVHRAENELGLTLLEDQIEGTAMWTSSPQVYGLHWNVGLAYGKDAERRAVFIQIFSRDRNYLGWNSITVNVDGEVFRSLSRLPQPSRHRLTQRGFTGWYEQTVVPLRVEHLPLLERIAFGENVLFRFSGGPRQIDIAFSEAQKRLMQIALDFLSEYDAYHERFGTSR